MPEKSVFSGLNLYLGFTMKTYKVCPDFNLLYDNFSPQFPMIKGHPQKALAHKTRQVRAALFSAPPQKPHSSKDCFVRDSMAFVLILASVGGVAPVCVGRRGGRWTVARSLGMQAYGCFVVPAMVIIIFGTGFLDYYLNYHPPAGHDCGGKQCPSMVYLVWIGNMILASAAVLAGWRSASERIRQMVKGFNDMEKINQDLGFEEKRSKDWKRLLFCILLQTAATTLLAYMYKRFSQSNVREKRTKIGYSPLLVMQWLVFLLAQQFSLSVMHVNSSLSAINSALEQELRTLDQQTNFTKFSRSCGWVRRLARHHGWVCDAADSLDHTYGTFLYFAFGNFLLYLIAKPYYLLHDIIEVGFVEVSVIALQMSWVGLYLLTIMAVIEPCHDMAVQMRLTRSLTAELSRRAACPLLQKSLRTLGAVLMLRQPHFAPLGLFTLDRPLIINIMSEVTTLLLVIIQFQQLTGYYKTD